MSKVSARWVPKLLTQEQQQKRAESSLDLLQRYQNDTENFLRRIVTGDEVWVYHYDPESKQESMAWVEKGTPGPVKARTRQAAGKIVASIFWDCEGPILVEYLEHKETINGQYYADQIARLHQALRYKRRGKLTEGILLLHDNAPAHRSQVAQAAIQQSRFFQLDHPPYSPDLAPSDFYLFPKMKKYLRGRRYETDDELRASVENWLETRPSGFYREGLEQLGTRLNKCFVNGGRYFEKL